MPIFRLGLSFFFFNDTATTEIYTLSLHDALPIYRAGDNGLAGTGWRDQHAEVVTGQGIVRCLLARIEARREFEDLWLPIGTCVGEVEVAADLGDEIAEAVEQAARQDQVPGEGLVIAAQEPGCVPG